MADNKGRKDHYVDNGWPQDLDDGEPAVTELATDRPGALSPFGEEEFPLSAEELPYMHPVTVINR